MFFPFTSRWPQTVPATIVCSSLNETNKTKKKKTNIASPIPTSSRPDDPQGVQTFYLALSAAVPLDFQSRPPSHWKGVAWMNKLCRFRGIVGGTFYNWPDDSKKKKIWRSIKKGSNSCSPTIVLKTTLRCESFWWSSSEFKFLVCQEYNHLVFFPSTNTL